MYFNRWIRAYAKHGLRIIDQLPEESRYSSASEHRKQWQVGNYLLEKLHGTEDAIDGRGHGDEDLVKLVVVSPSKSIRAFATVFEAKICGLD